MTVLSMVPHCFPKPLLPMVIFSEASAFLSFSSLVLLHLPLPTATMSTAPASGTFHVGIILFPSHVPCGTGSQAGEKRAHARDRFPGRGASAMGRGFYQASAVGRQVG